MIGLRAGYQYFLIAVGIACLIANVATSFGYLLSCASSTVSTALAVAPPLIVPFMIFGGFYLNSKSVPHYFKWFSYISWFKYGNEAFMINQWHGVENIVCTENVNCPKSGDMVLETYNFDPQNLKFDILALVVIIVVLRLTAYFFLLAKSRSKEHKAK